MPLRRQLYGTAREYHTYAAATMERYAALRDAAPAEYARHVRVAARRHDNNITRHLIINTRDGYIIAIDGYAASYDVLLSRWRDDSAGAPRCCVHDTRVIYVGAIRYIGALRCWRCHFCR